MPHTSEVRVTPPSPRAAAKSSESVGTLDVVREGTTLAVKEVTPCPCRIDQTEGRAPHRNPWGITAGPPGHPWDHLDTTRRSTDPPFGLGWTTLGGTSDLDHG